MNAKPLQFSGEGDDSRIIDLDDCGPGWLLYDVATARGFIEDTSRLTS